jgi:hypothetical protein
MSPSTSCSKLHILVEPPLFCVDFRKLGAEEENL